MNKILHTLILAFAFIGSITAQDIITAADLAKISKNSDLVIISCQTPAEYQKRHITNSINLNHKDLYKDGPVRGMLKPASDIAKILGAKGITNDKEIVLYDEGSYKYSARLYWILDYLGAENLKILDGQMGAWRRTKIPFTDSIPDIIEGIFIAKADPNKIATMSEVKEAQKNADVVIIDGRSADEYNGIAESEVQKGHIPGAINIPYEEVLTSRRKLKSGVELEKLFQANGLSPEKEIIVYCASGVRATVLYLAIKSGLGYPNVKVYDGAYLEWESIASNPVE